MAGGDSGAVLDTESGRRWDVALSFAGAQRGYVEQVAAALTARGVRCFYDADEQIDLWGRYLAEELPAVYSERAATVVVFVSAEYAERDWTRLERRAALNRAVQERREYVLPARFDETQLPGLLSDMVAVDLRGRTPEQFASMIAAKLDTLGIPMPGDVAEVRDPARDAGMARPPGAVRVSEADLRRLGVHAAISVPGMPDEDPPEYVPRDADAAEHGVRAKVAAAAQRGRFVLLVGGSSVGKTRCAAEAVKELLPDWWLVHPSGSAEVAALAAAAPGRTVVWLDELQRYLDGEGGLAGGVVRALLGGPGPVLLIATLWPDRYAAYTAVPAPGVPDPRAREREVLDLAAVIRIGAVFSPAEQDRARAAAARDRRLALALGAAGYGLTQTLAAAPQLVARWQDAQVVDPYGWAVLTAALDVVRLGGRAPLPADLLREAAPGYCTSIQQAEAPGDWFERALAYATEKLHGAAAALSPAGAGVMGQVAGYTVADYLLQHATRDRLPARVPASTWDAILSYVRDPADAVRLADSARNHRLYQHAIPLYRRAADGGDWYVAVRLDGLLAERGDLEGLRARADAGDLFAAARLTELLAERGDVDELRARADAGDKHAAVVLAGLLAERGDLDELRARADADDLLAALELADLLAERGDVDELRARADAGDDDAAARLDELLAERGDLDELRARADAGDIRAASWVPDLLAERGDLDEPRARADAGDDDAAAPLAEILLETLAHFRWPQNAGFLEEYLLAKHRLQPDSRAFAPLRRDERKAWDRAPGARDAYIAPALKPDGSANPRWITRSDWNLDRRIVATPRAERLFDLYKIYVLVGRPGSADATYLAPRTPVDALLEKYAQDILDTEPPPASASDEEFRAWRTHVRERAGIAIGEIRREDEPDRKQIARQLADLSDRERIWGRNATIETGGRGNKRP